MAPPGTVQPDLDAVRRARLTSPRAGTVLLATGVVAGLVGAAVSELLRLLQHLAFDYRSGRFEQAAERASVVRLLVVLSLGGLLGGVGWLAVRSRLPQGPGVEALLRSDRGRLAPLSSSLDALLQVLVVAMGASLGREGAPRQLSAVAGQLLAERAGLERAQVRLVLACASGAGLAAVYDVPLGGLLFVVELLLGSFAPRVVLPAALTCGLATVVAWVAVPRRPVYAVPPVPLTWSLVVAAVVGGPLLGLAGLLVARLVRLGRSHRPTGWRLPLSTTLVFAGLGGLAIAYPALLGNGRGPAQLAFLGDQRLRVLVVLAVLKPVVTAACLRSGANGGLITPALATGALTGGALGVLWGHVWTGAPVGTCAVLGAAALLATSLRAPLTGLVLTAELTGTPAHLLVPLALAVAGALLTSRLVEGRRAASSVRRRPRRGRP